MRQQVTTLTTPFGQPGFLQQLEQPHARGRHQAGGLEHEGVAGDDGQRDHPAPGDHGREVERSDAGEHAERLAVGHGVVTGGDVHERLALGDHRSGDTHLATLDDLDDLAHGLVEVLADLAGAGVGKLVGVRLEQGLPLVEHLGALLHRQLRPTPDTPCGGARSRPPPRRRCSTEPAAKTSPVLESVTSMYLSVVDSLHLRCHAVLQGLCHFISL